MDRNYFRSHAWLIYWYGRANKCENINCNYSHPKRFEWALKRGFVPEKKRENYIMLCPSCHRKMDYKQETKDKMSLQRKGKPAHNKTSIYSTDNEGMVVKYSSLTEASNQTGILITSICNNLKNKSKTAGGLIWHYQ